MTSLFDRMTRTADNPEEDPVPVPRYSTKGIPSWAGVCGLDPSVPVADWMYAAQCSAMACAAHVFGADAGRNEGWLPRKAPPAERWLRWLLDAAHDQDALRRMLALRLVCEQADVANDDQILQAAKDLHAACSLQRSR